jgi:hypothetical protein
VETGSGIKAEKGVTIIMEDEESEMMFMPGSLTSICPAKFTGKGRINGIPVNLNFHDLSLYDTTLYRTWGNIEFKNVIFEDQADLIFLAKDEIIINGPFKTGDDVQMVIKSICPVEN